MLVLLGMCSMVAPKVETQQHLRKTRHFIKHMNEMLCYLNCCCVFWRNNVVFLTLRATIHYFIFFNFHLWDPPRVLSSRCTWCGGLCSSYIGVFVSRMFGAACFLLLQVFFFFFLHASPYIPIYILPTPRALEEEKYIVVVYLHKRKTLAYSAPLSLRERL